MSSVVRTRPIASLPFVLMAVTIVVAAQLVTTAPVTSQPPRHSHPSAQQIERTALEEAAVTMTKTIVRPITPPPSAPPPPPSPPPPPPSVPAPAPTTTRTTTPTTTPSAPAPAVVAATPAPAPAPSDPAAVPPVGQATAWGCAAALAYLQAYAAKGFTLECPGYAEGREAMTCVNQAGVCPGTSVIAIADPCPQAYMNEASNSFVVLGTSDAPIDPFGPCP